MLHTQCCPNSTYSRPYLYLTACFLFTIFKHHATLVLESSSNFSTLQWDLVFNIHTKVNEARIFGLPKLLKDKDITDKL